MQILTSRILYTHQEGIYMHVWFSTI